MNQILEIPSEIERVESDTEKLTENKEKLESNEQKIQDSISKLNGDVAIIEKIESNLRDVQEKRQEVDDKIQECSSQLSDILSKIDEAEDKYQSSMETVEMAEQMGCDVGDSKSKIEERLEILSECRKQISEIADKLEVITSKENAGRTINRSGNTKSMNPKEYNAMMDKAVIEHGEMMKKATYMSPEQRNEEHAQYAQNAEKAKQEYAEQYRREYGETKIE